MPTAAQSVAPFDATGAVVRAVLAAGPLTIDEMSRRIGLPARSASDTVRLLERDGWLATRGARESGGAAVFDLRADAAFVLGLDLGGTKLHAAVADLRGRVVAEGVEPTDQRGGQHVVEQIGRLADVLARRGDVPDGRIRIGAMGSPGVVDPRSGGIAIAPNIPGLDEIDVGAALKGRLGFAVAIENDVNLAAVGEAWRGARGGAANFAFIAVGTGIGMGIVADGELLHGARGAAGEIAYLPLGADPFDRRNLRLGTLETAIGSRAIVARYEALGGAPGKTVRQIFDVIGTDQAACVALDDVARILATAILAVHSVLDPERVVLGGSIGSRPELSAMVERHLAACMSRPVRVEISVLGSRATLTGAIGSALDSFYRSVFAIPWLRLSSSGESRTMSADGAAR
ncbi:ROK family protein [Rhodovastum sp. RN2-1]|uniref:ROK family protein n=2 Tax=Limobrevibacterium gyesilva TaxID=2991712 RepID=A0AA41YLQ3_9PROT|nr:ROK family protein [Limobrevibacterium gyesilva]